MLPTPIPRRGSSSMSLQPREGSQSGRSSTASKYTPIYLRDCRNDGLADDQTTEKTKVKQDQSSILIKERKTHPNKLQKDDQPNRATLHQQFNLLPTLQDHHKNLSKGEHSKEKTESSDNKSSQFHFPNKLKPRVNTQHKLGQDTADTNLPQFLPEYSSNQVRDRNNDVNLRHSQLPDIGLEHSSMILYPRCSPECPLRGNKNQYCLIPLQLKSLRHGQYEEGIREGIAAMIEQLPQGRARFGPPRLLPINCIQSRIGPYAKRSEYEAIVGHILLQGIVVSQDIDIGDYDEQPPDESDEIRRNPQRHPLDSPLPVRRQRVVEEGVLA